MSAVFPTLLRHVLSFLAIKKDNALFGHGLHFLCDRVWRDATASEKMFCFVPTASLLCRVVDVNY
jgi:hypothetical protein